MLGSLQDAEDALQDTLLAAWQGLGGFEGRASIRTWLYRIATNQCLDARRSASRRPAKEWDVPQVKPPEPTRLGEIVWLQPFPDALLKGALYEGRDPAARFCASIFRSGPRFDLVRTRANGQRVFGAYLRANTGIRHAVGLYVLTLTGNRICAMTRFENSVLPWFGLPRSLPSQY